MGITGTKGKTTTSYMLKEILELAGFKVGIIGTVETKIDGVSIDNYNTTPESYLIYKALFNMVNKNCQVAILEVSSQGLMLDRVLGIEFDYGVFTNIGEDHIGINEHRTFKEYLEAKSILFKQSKMIVANGDDSNCFKVLSKSKCAVITYGQGNNNLYKIENILLNRENGSIGIGFDLTESKKLHIILKVPGAFNVYNATAAALTARAMGVDNEEIINALENVVIRGRVEKIVDNGKYSVVIDYAHNGMALKNLLLELKKYKPKRLVLVFGCGGNRAKSRRYEMGKVGGNLADLIILTSDNPRWEDPMKIILDILSGIGENTDKTIIIEDRKSAIEYAIKNHEVGDLIVIAGKGHETYQLISGEKRHFDDKEIVLSIEEEKKDERFNYR